MRSVQCAATGQWASMRQDEAGIWRSAVHRKDECFVAEYDPNSVIIWELLVAMED